MSGDETLKDLLIAQRTRKALELIGHARVPRCLPGEPEHARCGGDAIGHAKAYLAAMGGMIRHLLSHADPETAAWLDKVAAQAEADVAEHCPFR